MSFVTEINRIDQLAEYKSLWSSLLEQTAGASFFQSLQWLEIFWKHFGSSRKLRVLVVEREQEPAGILPLVVESEQTRVGVLRVLTYPLNCWGSYYGPIGPDPSGTLRCGLQHVQNTPRDWDLVELRWVGAVGTDPNYPGRVMREVGMYQLKTILDRTAIVDMQAAGSWEEYLAAKTSKWRNNFRRWRRKLEQQGKLSWERYRPAGTAGGEDDPRWDLYEECNAIAAQSWQGSSTTGTTISHESISSFLQEVHVAAAKHGAVDLCLMRLDGKPLAFAYNYYHKGSVYGLRVGYDEDKSRAGAGNLLYARVIEDGFQRGDQTHDLGVGSLEIKRYFISYIRPIYRYSYYHPMAIRAQLIRIKRAAESRQLAREEQVATMSNEA